MGTVMSAGAPEVNGDFEVRDAAKLIPEKFALVCDQNGWNTKEMWAKLSGAGSGSADGDGIRWFEAPNKSYIYFNVMDRHWWIDGPDGLGVYKARGPHVAVPAYPRGSGGAFGWFALDQKSNPVPTLLVYRGTADAAHGKGDF